MHVWVAGLHIWLLYAQKYQVLLYLPQLTPLYSKQNKP
jgi:hypothetical protein